VRIAVGVAAAVVLAVALAACGSAHDTTRRQLTRYLQTVNRTERQLGAPLNTVDVVDHQLTASANAGRRGTSTAAAGSGAPLDIASAQRRLAQAELQIRTVSGRLRALVAPPPAAHLKGLLIALIDRQAELTTQTRRLIAFIPGFTRSLVPLGPAVVALERVLTVNQASGATAVNLVYARKAAALRTFGRTLDRILASLAQLRPPASSRPTYLAERHSLRRMHASAATLAADLAGGHTAGLTAVLRSFDRAAVLPGSRSAQAAEDLAIRAYNRRVDELGTLVTAADRERLRLSQSVQ
jgi:hypothetical protein